MTLADDICKWKTTRKKKTQENRDQNVNQRQKNTWTINYINNKRS